MSFVDTILARIVAINTREVGRKLLAESINTNLRRCVSVTSNLKGYSSIFYIPPNERITTMFRRIEEGTTTVGDKYLVIGLIIAAFFLGVGVGMLF